MHICFVAHFAYRALSGSSDGHIGGVERQTNLMAKWFAARGHKVSVIVWNEGQPEVSECDGVRIISVCRQDQGLPGLRFFVPRWSSLRRALKLADADIYYHNCAEYVTGQVAHWAHTNNRQFVYSVASDPDCLAAMPTLSAFRERYLYRYGLTTADLVIAQTEYQKRLLQSEFSRPAVVLPMPCEVLPPVESAEAVSYLRHRILWIGRLDRVKRPELVLKIAALCPQYDFDIVGPSGDDAAYNDRLHQESESLDNISWIGSVDFSGVRRYYEASSVLLCTSEFEGFPNTFLEAWSCGCPVVSTVDPDDLIQSQQLGHAVDSVNDIPGRIASLVEDAQELQRIGDNCIRYFEVHHEKDVAMRRFEVALRSLTGERSVRR